MTKWIALIAAVLAIPAAIAMSVSWENGQLECQRADYVARGITVPSVVDLELAKASCKSR